MRGEGGRDLSILLQRNSHRLDVRALPGSAAASHRAPQVARRSPPRLPDYFAGTRGPSLGVGFRQPVPPRLARGLPGFISRVRARSTLGGDTRSVGAQATGVLGGLVFAGAACKPCRRLRSEHENWRSQAQSSIRLIPEKIAEPGLRGNLSRSGSSKADRTLGEVGPTTPPRFARSGIICTGDLRML